MLTFAMYCSPPTHRAWLAPHCIPASSFANAPVRSAAMSFRMRSSAKLARNPFAMCSFKTKDLKLFIMNSFRKNLGGRVILLTRNPSKALCAERQCRATELRRKGPPRSLCLIALHGLNLFPLAPDALVRPLSSLRPGPKWNSAPIPISH
jgi:hypothetical protein